MGNRDLFYLIFILLSFTKSNVSHNELCKERDGHMRLPASCQSCILSLHKKILYLSISLPVYPMYFKLFCPSVPVHLHLSVLYFQRCSIYSDLLIFPSASSLRPLALPVFPMFSVLCVVALFPSLHPHPCLPHVFKGVLAIHTLLSFLPSPLSPSSSLLCSSTLILLVLLFFTPLTAALSCHPIDCVLLLSLLTVFRQVEYPDSIQTAPKAFHALLVMCVWIS